MKFACRAAAPAIAAAAALFCSAARIEAAPIVIFSDNFEDAAANALPNAPQAGAYPTDTATDPESIVVAAGGTRPASPAAGSNLLYLFGKQRNYGLFDASGQGTVRYELDARLESGTTALQFGMTGDAGASSLDLLPTTLWIQLLSSGAIQAYDTANGGWQTIAGISQTPGTWQHYAIEYELGATSYTLTAGANTVTSSRFNGTTSATQIDHAFAHGGTNSTAGYFDNIVVTFDAVPEPGSLALLAGGAGMLLARRRRDGESA
jgi:hypothetical protein